MNEDQISVHNDNSHNENNPKKVRKCVPLEIYQQTFRENKKLKQELKKLLEEKEGNKELKEKNEQIKNLQEQVKNLSFEI